MPSARRSRSFLELPVRGERHPEGFEVVGCEALRAIFSAVESARAISGHSLGPASKRTARGHDCPGAAIPLGGQGEIS
jgi:hypothetical protein